MAGELGRGTYTVAWRVISADSDPHQVPPFAGARRRDRGVPAVQSALLAARLAEPDQSDLSSREAQAPVDLGENSLRPRSTTRRVSRRPPAAHARSTARRSNARGRDAIRLTNLGDVRFIAEPAADIGRSRCSPAARRALSPRSPATAATSGSRPRSSSAAARSRSSPAWRSAPPTASWDCACRSRSSSVAWSPPPAPAAHASRLSRRCSEHCGGRPHRRGPVGTSRRCGQRPGEAASTRIRSPHAGDRCARRRRSRAPSPCAG
jgi:hypothetical protein